MEDSLGDYLKSLERAAQPANLDPTLPIYARIDGRGFSRFTKGMMRPFDPRMTKAMAFTAQYLVEQTHAVAAYVQSDEISLLWGPAKGGQSFFGGKPFKLTSIISGLSTAAFTHALLNDPDGLDDYARLMPHFDCRVVQPAKADAVSFFSWRGQDARRNATSQIARAHFSHKALQGKSSSEMKELLRNIGVFSEKFNPESLNGTLLLRRSEKRNLAPEELARIPLAHRPQPGTLFDRSIVRRHSATHPGQIKNLEAVLFGGANPA
jgi:tRNA(His) 5'-end guanylyltransferase